MTQSGVPLPSVAALVGVFEFFGAIALILGVWTRPLAVLFAFFTLAAGLIGHRYWTMTSADRFMNMINFYKTSASWAVSSCCTSRAQENTQSTQGWDCLMRRRDGRRFPERCWIADRTTSAKRSISVRTAATGMSVCACGAARRCPGWYDGKPVLPENHIRAYL